MRDADRGAARSLPDLPQPRFGLIWFDLVCGWSWNVEGTWGELEPSSLRRFEPRFEMFVIVRRGLPCCARWHFSVLANACLLPCYSLQSNQLNRGRLLCSPSPLFAEPKAQRVGERQVDSQADFLARAAGCSGSESPEVRFGSSRSLR